MVQERPPVSTLFKSLLRGKGTLLTGGRDYFRTAPCYSLENVFSCGVVMLITWGEGGSRGGNGNGAGPAGWETDRPKVIFGTKYQN